jgi:hypothetical protein
VLHRRTLELSRRRLGVVDALVDQQLGPAPDLVVAEITGFEDDLGDGVAGRLLERPGLLADVVDPAALQRADVHHAVERAIAAGHRLLGLSCLRERRRRPEREPDRCGRQHV